MRQAAVGRAAQQEVGARRVGEREQRLVRVDGRRELAQAVREPVCDSRRRRQERGLSVRGA